MINSVVSIITKTAEMDSKEQPNSGIEGIIKRMELRLGDIKWVAITGTMDKKEVEDL